MSVVEIFLTSASYHRKLMVSERLRPYLTVDSFSRKSRTKPDTNGTVRVEHGPTTYYILERNERGRKRRKKVALKGKSSKSTASNGQLLLFLNY